MDRDGYPAGVPCWIDLEQDDPEAAAAFYGGFFGWELADQMPPGLPGHYFAATMRGKDVAGIGSRPEGAPPEVSWRTYVWVDSADAAAARARELGGTVTMGPMDVMDAGRMAVCTDPQGAFFSVWQPLANVGCAVVNEPGAFCWSELNTRDPEAAKAFYPQVFDWGVHSSAGPMEYSEWQLDGESIAGMMAMPPMVPAEVPPYWLVYFAVADTDATVAQAKDLGAMAMVEGMDTPAGRLAVLADPQGAAFAVITMPAA